MNAGLHTRHTLIQRIKDPEDEVSWEEFCRYYRDYLFVIIRNMKISHHDAEELLQDILIKAWKALPEFNYNPERGKFRWWLCRITKNTVLTFLSKKKRQGGEKQEVDEEHTLELVSEPDIDRIAEDEWQKYVSQLAWNNIKGEFSENVLQSFLDIAAGIPARDVAEKLGVGENTVYVYKKRIQKRLCREIAKIDYELNC